MANKFFVFRFCGFILEDMISIQDRLVEEFYINYFSSFS